MEPVSIQEALDEACRLLGEDRLLQSLEARRPAVTTEQEPENGPE